MGARSSGEDLNSFGLPSLFGRSLYKTSTASRITRTIWLFSTTKLINEPCFYSEVKGFVTQLDDIIFTMSFTLISLHIYRDSLIGNNSYHFFKDFLAHNCHHSPRTIREHESRLHVFVQTACHVLNHNTLHNQFLLLAFIKICFVFRCPLNNKLANRI